MRNKRQIDLMDQALAELTVDVETNPDPLQFPIKASRIDYLPAELILPDPVQARRVLPEAIHGPFHEQRLTPVQALQELVRTAQLAARQQGRPFTNVTDLLAELTKDDDVDTPKYTPEESLVRDLVTLAVTIRDDGQVNPLTVIDITQGLTRLFRIETGERRFWASWLLREFLPGYNGNGTIPCIILKADQSSVFRQARENMARSGLSAIAMARQAALLLMAVHGIPKPDFPVDNDFYRQALDLDLRDKREYTDDILAAMGGISRSYLSRYKALIALTDEALEIADRHGLDEGHLRWVLKLRSEDQAEMIRQIIQFGLTRNQVREMCIHVEDEPKEQESEISEIDKNALRLVRLMRASQPITPDELYRALLSQEKDIRFAKARLQILKEVVHETEIRFEET